jgi:tetratricopeptide (TPR) repeat protein
MAKSIIKVILIAAMLFAGADQSLAAGAQRVEILEAIKKYQALNKQGKYAEAILFAEKSNELIKKEFGATHSIFAYGLNNLAELYRKQGRYAAAEPLYKRSLAIHEKALGPIAEDLFRR